MLHRLVERQLKKLGLSSKTTPPKLEIWQQFLERVSQSYFEADRERYLLERSLTISSREMQALFESLQLSSEMRLAEVRTINEKLLNEIIEHERAEKALRYSEQRTYSIINTALDAVITMDAEGLIMDWNTQAEIIFGWSRHEVVKRFLSAIIIPTQYREAHIQGLKHYLASGEGPVLNKRIEIMALHRDGHEFPVELAISPLRLGERVIFSAFIRDITKRKQAEAALALAHDQALEASRLKSELLANVSHDLRTPLMAILGYTDLLQAGAYGSLSDKQQTVATRIMVNTKQLLLFINNILDQAQIDAGKVELRVSSFKPLHLIETIQSTMGVLAQAKGLELTSYVDPEVHPTLSGDFQRLQAILMNLVSNSIKFTKQGTIRIYIYQPDSGQWALQVSDTGCGIPVAAQAYIFDPFRRGDNSSTKDQTGSGLGLSIVKRLTTLMGGQITLASEPEQGSSFTIVLPLPAVGEKAKT